MNNIELWRAKFEEITVKSMKCVDIKRLPNGEYAIPLIEDHWQIFQEGWQECEKYFKETEK